MPIVGVSVEIRTGSLRSASPKRYRLNQFARLQFASQTVADLRTTSPPHLSRCGSHISPVSNSAIRSCFDTFCGRGNSQQHQRTAALVCWGVTFTLRSWVSYRSSRNHKLKRIRNDSLQLSCIRKPCQLLLTSYYHCFRYYRYCNRRGPAWGVILILLLLLLLYHQGCQQRGARWCTSITLGFGHSINHHIKQ